jgi:ankyrin repeat protein
MFDKSDCGIRAGLMTTISNELNELFERIKSTPDYSYVDFSDIHATNALGNSALHIAVYWGDIEAVKLLLAAGLDVNKHGEHGYTPLHCACESGHLEVVKLLLDAGANLFSRTEGYIPFTVARLNSNDAICDFLAECMRSSPHKPKSTPANQHAEALKKEIETLEIFIQNNCEKK